MFGGEEVAWGGMLLLVALLAASSARATFARRSVWLNCLVPTWRFFERVDSPPELLVRWHVAACAPGAWEPLIPRGPRPLCAIFWNPEGNLALACYTLVDQLVAEMAEASPLPLNVAEQLVSYRLVQTLCQYYADRSRGTSEGTSVTASAALHYQFKIVRIRSAAAESEEELFVSEVYGMGAQD